MNNLLWGLAVLVLVACANASPIGEEEVAVEEVKPENVSEVEEVVEELDVTPMEKVEEAEEMVEEEEVVEEENGIKEGNKKKCDKCLAPIFRHKHDSFCVKCAATGEINLKEQDLIATALKCKKCRKSKFRSRHGEFCDQQCQPTTTTTTTTTTMEPEEVEEIIEEVIEEVVEEIVDEIVPKKKKKNKKNKNKKNKKHHKDETIKISNDVDDSYDTKFETTMIENDSSVNTVEEAENLGIFGSILKHLIVSNTWGTAN
jgi:hypothetical protein